MVSLLKLHWLHKKCHSNHPRCTLVMNWVCMNVCTQHIQERGNVGYKARPQVSNSSGCRGIPEKWGRRLKILKIWLNLSKREKDDVFPKLSVTWSHSEICLGSNTCTNTLCPLICLGCQWLRELPPGKGLLPVSFHSVGTKTHSDLVVETVRVR